MSADETSLPLINIRFNFIGQMYSTFVGIVTLPLLLKYVGAEGFGLIGFFTLLQTLMAILDMGLLPALGRDISRAKVSADGRRNLRTLVNSVEVVFAGVAIVIAITLAASSGWIAVEWLTLDTLPPELVMQALWIIAATLAFRWMAALNRSGIVAHEDQVWVNFFDMAIATLRFPMSLLVVFAGRGDLTLYFCYQALVAGLEFLGLRWKLHQLLPPKTWSTRRFSRAELVRILPFAGGVAYGTIVWVLLTQLDKLILSSVLPLSHYGYFVLVVTITAGISMMSTPISRAILPRMTSLQAAGQPAQMLEVYRSATRYVMCISMPVTLVIAFWPHEVILAWSGDKAAADWASDVLPLYALGGGLTSMTAFQYFLQYAYGDLKLFTRFNTFSLLVNVPLIIYAALEHGAIGVAWVWFVFRLFSFMLWVPVVHSKLAPRFHRGWMLQEVVPTFLACLLATLSGYLIWVPSLDASRLELIAFLAAMVFLAFGAGFIVSSPVLKSIWTTVATREKKPCR